MVGGLFCTEVDCYRRLPICGAADFDPASMRESGRSIEGEPERSISTDAISRGPLLHELELTMGCSAQQAEQKEMCAGFHEGNPK